MSRSSTVPKNAILLGAGKWIEHIDLTGRYGAAVNVDLLLKGLEPVWSALETECVAGCCGFDAFDFSAENIAIATAKLNSAVVCAQLSKLRLELGSLGADVVVSQRLNNYADQRVFDALIAHLQSNFAGQDGGDA
jgi:hypothetical protein